MYFKTYEFSFQNYVAKGEHCKMKKSEKESNRDSDKNCCFVRKKANVFA